MKGISTIQLDKSLIQKLREAKEYPEQTYNSLLEKMLNIFEQVKKSDHNDKYLYQIQQQKMKELWNNKEDEAWENA
jgi:hypothetical protein